MSEQSEMSDLYPNHWVQEFQIGNCTVRVHRPILTPEETEMRHKKIMDELVCASM